MGKAEIVTFVILTNILLLVFISVLILLLFQYRKRKMLHEKEKQAIEDQHKLEILNNELHVQKQVMQFIGGELHDSVTQKLTLASIYSQRIEFENHGNKISESIKKISFIINDSLIELRDLSRTLTEARLQQRSLADLLEVECSRINDTQICKSELNVNFEGKMSIAVKSTLLRILQEFIQNSLKHSGCNHISINLQDTGTALHINAADNGKGFDMLSVKATGIGLNNMQRRAMSIDSSFELVSKPGEGTAITMIIDHNNL